MFEEIRKKLLVFRRRWRLVNAISYLAKGALAGVLFSVFLFLLGIFVSIPNIYHLAGGAVSIGLLGGLLFAFIQPISLRKVALLVDKRAVLDERASTALEYAEKQDLPFHNPLLNDALHHTLSLSPRRYLPLRLPDEVKFVAFGLAALVVINFLPKYRFAEIRKKKRTQVRMTAAAKEVKKASAKLEKALKAEEDLEMARLKEEMKALAEALKRGQLTKKEALAKMAQLAEKIKKLEAEKKALAAARSELAKAEELDEALKASEQGKSDKFKSSVKALAKKVSGAAEGGGLSPEESSALDDALAGAQGAAGQSKGLQEAIKKTREALASKDAAGLEAGLENIASALEGANYPGGLSGGLAGAGMSLSDAQRALAGLPVRAEGAMAGAEGLSPGGLAAAYGFCPHGVPAGGT
jgi:hypothetical protein